MLECLLIMTLDFGDRRKPEVSDRYIPEISHDREFINVLAKATKSRGGQIILDIGCGGKLSVNATRGSFVVGVEPHLDHFRLSEIKVAKDSHIVFFDDKADALPEGLNPDLALYVSPDPEEIGSILYELERIKGPDTRVIIVFDNTSYEGTHGGMNRGISTAIGVLHEMGMKTKKVRGSVDSFENVLKMQGIVSGGNLESSHILGEG